MSIENDSSQVRTVATVQTAEAGQTVETAQTAQSVQALTADAGYPTFPLAPGYRVNVRSGPGTSYAVVDVLPAGGYVSIRCQCSGTRVSGPYGTTDIWDCIGNSRFVSDAYVKTGSDGYVAGRCG